MPEQTVRLGVRFAWWARPALALVRVALRAAALLRIPLSAPCQDSIREAIRRLAARAIRTETTTD